LLASPTTSGITVETTIKSDTKEAVDEITRACEDPVTLLTYFNTSRRRLHEHALPYSRRRLERMLMGGISAALEPVDPTKPLAGLPMMVVDVNSLDTYPGPSLAAS
jgi:hypothetical protein